MIKFMILTSLLLSTNVLAQQGNDAIVIVESTVAQVQEQVQFNTLRMDRLEVEVNQLKLEADRIQRYRSHVSSGSSFIQSYEDFDARMDEIQEAHGFRQMDAITAFDQEEVNNLAERLEMIDQCAKKVKESLDINLSDFVQVVSIKKSDTEYPWVFQYRGERDLRLIVGSNAHPDQCANDFYVNYIRPLQ